MDARGEVAVVTEDVQVAAKPRRQTYTAEYKRRTLKEADACTAPGAIGALLRREALYSSVAKSEPGLGVRPSSFPYRSAHGERIRE